MLDQILPALPDHQQHLLSDALTTGYGLWAGVELIEIADRMGRISFRPRVEMLTPWGTLNGGVVSSLVEIPSFLALLTTLNAGELPVTNDIFIQHVRPFPGDATYELTGTLMRRGRTMAWTEVTVGVAGEPLSFARITKTIIKRSA